MQDKAVQYFHFTVSFLILKTAGNDLVNLYSLRRSDVLQLICMQCTNCSYLSMFLGIIMTVRQLLHDQIYSNFGVILAIWLELCQISFFLCGSKKGMLLFT